MKAIYQWDSTDVDAGMIVCRAHRSKHKWEPDGWTAKWTHKIGFCPELRQPFDKKNAQSGGAHYCQIAMTDGMVYCTAMTKAQMAKKLTEQDMIPMPYSWWLRMVRYLRNQTNPVSPHR